MLLYNMVACFNAIDGIAQLAMTNYYKTNNMVYDVKSWITSSKDELHVDVHKNNTYWYEMVTTVI